MPPPMPPILLAPKPNPVRYVFDLGWNDIRFGFCCYMDPYMTRGLLSMFFRGDYTSSVLMVVDMALLVA